MKSIKKLSLILAAVFMISGAAMANGPKEIKSKRIDPKVRAEKMTTRMTEEYKLTDVQAKQLLEVNQELVEKVGDRPVKHNHHGNKDKKGQMDNAKEEKKNKDMSCTDCECKDGKDCKDCKKCTGSAKLSSEKREKRHEEMKQVRNDYNLKLQKIMNADQYQAYTKKQAEHEQKRHERGDKMKDNRSKKGTSAKVNKKKV